jgi:hypothetical protein
MKCNQVCVWKKMDRIYLKILRYTRILPGEAGETYNGTQLGYPITDPD